MLYHAEIADLGEKKKGGDFFQKVKFFGGFGPTVT
jgi:hypothetical protein